MYVHSTQVVASLQVLVVGVSSLGDLLGAGLAPGDSLGDSLGAGLELGRDSLGDSLEAGLPRLRSRVVYGLERGCCLRVVR
jgi:hypothetical protein